MPRLHIPYEGPHTLDLTDLDGALVDMAEGSRQGMRTEMEGFDEARHQLEGTAEADRQAAGITPELYQHFTMCTDRVALLDRKLAVALKQVEVLVESRAYYVDAQQNDVGLMVDSMKSHAKRRRDRGILVPFEKLLRYASQVGDKGAQTKRRKAAEAAALAAGAPKKGKAAPGRGGKAKAGKAPAGKSSAQDAVAIPAAPSTAAPAPAAVASTTAAPTRVVPTPAAPAPSNLATAPALPNATLSTTASTVAPVLAALTPVALIPALAPGVQTPVVLNAAPNAAPGATVGRASRPTAVAPSPDGPTRASGAGPKATSVSALVESPGGFSPAGAAVPLGAPPGSESSPQQRDPD